MKIRTNNRIQILRDAPAKQFCTSALGCLLCFFISATVLADDKSGPQSNCMDYPTESEMIRCAGTAPFEEAYKTLKPLVDKKHPKAMHYFGILLLSKPEIYLYEAFINLVGAAKAGEANAQLDLAHFIKSDPYLENDLYLRKRESFRWRLAAARQGFVPGMLAVGEMLAKGSAPRKDYVEAYMWLTLADKLHRWERHGQKHMDDMIRSGLITQEQIQEALKRAEELEKNHPDTFKPWPIKKQDD